MTDDGSSSSDDEYLTLNDSSKDRESLVRKKLLENFYGKSAVAAAAARSTNVVGENEDEDDDDDDDDDDNNNDNNNDHDVDINRNGPASRSMKDRDNLDSSAFDSAAHTQRHVLHSRVRDLLEVEERLALQVRTLDSTMQTLVYENYSRFIDATDAIRSIGVNVQANEAGLRTLSERMYSVDIAAKDTEELLGGLRDQVAEKIRVKRLLTRLDALLKLPQTLLSQISEGNYRSATKSYISASTILDKHSHGFESLKKIADDCTLILIDMRKLLTKKLFHWNGRVEEFLADGREEVLEDDLPESPKSMSEIFECVGTLHILMDDPTIQWNRNEHRNVSPLVDLEKYDLQAMAFGATTRALDRILDAHLIQVQERRYASLGTTGVDPAAIDLQLPPTMTTTTTTTRVANQAAANVSTTEMTMPLGADFVPKNFLDSLLEVATLYGLSFGTDAQPDLLREFIAESFASFLSHVRSLLLEESAFAKENAEGEEPANEEGISNALVLLVQAVKEMSAGLSLPEVGVNAEFCSKMVAEVMQLTDSMVTMQVRQKFNDLRFNVAKVCLLPFAERLVEQIAINSSLSSKESVVHVRMIASTTVSDCLQLVDDTIRSILSATTAAGYATKQPASNHNNIPAVLKTAVQDGAKEFTDWLAGAMEMLAGGEDGNPERVIDVPQEGTGSNDERFEESEEGISTTESAFGNRNNYLRNGKDSENTLNFIQTARDALLERAGIEPMEQEERRNKSILAVAEMCRLCSSSYAENLEQTVSAHLGTGKRKSRHLFAQGEQLEPRDSAAKPTEEEENELSLRFKIAASRVFALYCYRKGSEAAALLTKDIQLLFQSQVSVGEPRPCVQSALKVAKDTAVVCSAIFDCPARAGPVPFVDAKPIGIGGPSSPAGFTIKSSIQLDVERMFKEKVVIHLHPSEQLDFSRNALVFLMMKVAFRAFLEAILLFRFSPDGFKQFQVDVEFLKLMIPHYMDENFTWNGNNACNSLSTLLSDVMDAVAERCINDSCENDKDLHQDSLAALRLFMTRAVKDQSIGSCFVIEEN